MNTKAFRSIFTKELQAEDCSIFPFHLFWMQTARSFRQRSIMRSIWIPKASLQTSLPKHLSRMQAREFRPSRTKIMCSILSWNHRRIRLPVTIPQPSRCRMQTGLSTQLKLRQESGILLFPKGIFLLISADFTIRLRDMIQPPVFSSFLVSGWKTARWLTKTESLPRKSFPAGTISFLNTAWILMRSRLTLLMTMQRLPNFSWQIQDAVCLWFLSREITTVSRSPKPSQSIKISLSATANLRIRRSSTRGMSLTGQVTMIRLILMQELMWLKVFGATVTMLWFLSLAPILPRSIINCLSWKLQQIFTARIRIPPTDRKLSGTLSLIRIGTSRFDIRAIHGTAILISGPTARVQRAFLPALCSGRRQLLTPTVCFIGTVPLFRTIKTEMFMMFLKTIPSRANHTPRRATATVSWCTPELHSVLIQQHRLHLCA